MRPLPPAPLIRCGCFHKQVATEISAVFCAAPTPLDAAATTLRVLYRDVLAVHGRVGCILLLISVQHRSRQPAADTPVDTGSWRSVPRRSWLPQSGAPIVGGRVS